MAILSTSNLIKIYGSGENAVYALNGVTLSIQQGEFVAIVGTSGNGKSTLLHMLGELDCPTSGSILSFIVGLIGVLNFLNAVLTGIITRHREFAMLQSIGMTGKQLKKMLVLEGLYYTLGSVVISFLLTAITSPITAQVLENIFWFFDYQFTITPLFITTPIFAVLGVALPLISYCFLAKKSIVERLREVE